MPSKLDCLGLGITPLDILLTVPRFPKAGSKINALDMTIQGGGPVPNVLVGLTKLGYQTSLISAFGDDSHGRDGLSQLRAEGVDVSRTVIRTGKKSDLASGFIETGSGQRTLVFATEIQVNPADIKLSDHRIPRLIHLDGRDVPACAKLARWGRRQGLPVGLDVGSMRNDVTPLLPLVDHLVVADAFAYGFTGKRTAPAAARRLAEYCKGTIVVTVGLRGAVALEEGKLYQQPAFRIKTIDTTGAGDAFHTGYYHGLLNGDATERRLLLGAAVAALKCTRPGARAGLPTLRQLNSFLRSKPKTYA